MSEHRVTALAFNRGGSGKHCLGGLKTECRSGKREIGMTQKLMWLIAATLLLIGFVLYLRQPGDNLNVTPDARREIDKAKRR